MQFDFSLGFFFVSEYWDWVSLGFLEATGEVLVVCVNVLIFLEVPDRFLFLVDVVFPIF